MRFIFSEEPLLSSKSGCGSRTKKSRTSASAAAAAGGASASADSQDEPSQNRPSLRLAGSTPSKLTLALRGARSQPARSSLRPLPSSKAPISTLALAGLSPSCSLWPLLLVVRPLGLGSPSVERLVASLIQLGKKLYTSHFRHDVVTDDEGEL